MVQRVVNVIEGSAAAYPILHRVHGEYHIVIDSFQKTLNDGIENVVEGSRAIGLQVGEGRVRVTQDTFDGVRQGLAIHWGEKVLELGHICVCVAGL